MIPHLGKECCTGDAHEEDGDDPCEELLGEELPVYALEVDLEQPDADDGAHDALGAASRQAPLQR